MAAIVMRRPEPGEAAAVFAVHEARATHSDRAPVQSLGDIELEIASPRLETWVAELEGRMLGVGLLDEREGWVTLHPHAAGEDVYGALRKRLETSMRQRGLTAARLQVPSHDAAARSWLAAAGYRPTCRFEHFHIDLAKALYPARSAVRARPFVVDADDGSCHALIAAAFADVPSDLPTTYGHFRDEVLDRPGFAPELSSVIERDGRPIACVLSNRAGAQGQIACLAVERPARGVGLGRALLHIALSAFRDAGLTSGSLWVDVANAPAVALYSAAGMLPDDSSERWERPFTEP